MKKDNIVKYSVISVFVSLYFLVATISMIHSIKFFGLSNSNAMSVTLSVAFELGQVAALCGILILDKTSKGVVWALFLLLTSMQIMSNVYFSYVNLGDYKAWSELFGLVEEDAIFQKRILSIISGGILPIVALGFIKSLVDYLKPEQVQAEKITSKPRVETTVISLDDKEIVESTAGERLDISLDIKNELEEPTVQEPIIEEVIKPTEHVKQIVTKKVDISRTPGQYIDPITGGGSIRPTHKKI